jgi:acetyltransferase EpsM
MAKPIYIPLLNPNEPEALLAGLHVTEGQLVQQGDLLCTLETTKSTAEVLAEAGGYILGLSVLQGQTVLAGVNPTSDEPPVNLRITQPALALARQHNLDFSQLPRDVFITEDFVRNLLAKQSGKLDLLPPSSAIDPTAIFVYGGGGHGKAVIELLRALRSYRVMAVIDDGIPAGGAILGTPLLGGVESLADLYAQGVRLAVNAVGGIGNLAIRIQIFNRLAQAGFACPAIVHPTAYIEPSANLSAGVQVFPHAYIGSEARLGFGCIVNTGAIVSHDCTLGDYVNISPGAILAGEVQVGSGALIGMGATINLRASIGAGVRIGNGATVKSDVPEQGIVRAGHIWPE